MDGLPYLPSSNVMMSSGMSPGGFARQTTLKAAISCTGVGLHGGQRVRLRLRPASVDHGVSFLRTDLGVAIPARFDTVVDTLLCTVVARPGEPAARVGTIEHLMAALAAAGIDNVVAEVDGPEIPILDGSAEPWLFLLDCAGIVEQGAPRRVIEVVRTVRVESGDAFAELRPRRSLGGGHGLDMALSIDFAAPAIGRQALTLAASPAAIRRELVRARTFCLRQEIDGLRRAGLARGGSLDNAIVVDGASILNPAGLRMADEFIRHKMLDAVGDLALAGVVLRGRFLGRKSGHALNNQALRALFADSANWRTVAAAEALLAA